MRFSKEEKIQYSRHLILEEIGEEGQQKIGSSKVLVIGAGGLGCPVLQYLTAAGIGHIGIVDDDVVDQTNLQRQILYTIDDIGKPKAITASKRLEKLNPYIFFKVYNERLTKENVLDIFSEYDIVVDGSDNFPTRYLVNDACVLLDKPLVFGSIFKFQGQVSVFNYKGGATYRCLYPTPPEPDAVPNCSEIGVLGVLPGIIGSFQANEVIKMVLEIGDVLSGKLLCIDALSLQQYILSVTKNEASDIVTLADDYDFFCGILPAGRIVEITAQEVQNNLQEYQILDVRTQEEFEQFNLGGIHIPIEEMDDKIHQIQSDKPIVVCCQSGVRSKIAIRKILALRNDLNLLNLTNGLAVIS
ncbi:HesA/MoeB/ThiF family protein [Aquimarina sp. TRL1]|uniref:HesA/MoeB/ThiF family protein n=1 Tax=Aquimarina sp. (strain TRL1) TaxID=2736252 RepID=UPI00158903A1|nr:HesA/MoeB/ThiF family protein [Aquimarina sp. TRL1]QKX04458.1 HesA/MoeB/ThiF family protein [Aquimarina sp. TRL1]